MNVNQINAYLDRAREIIGDRSPREIEYDDAVVAHLSAGKDIKRAIRAANEEHTPIRGPMCWLGTGI
jgi:hypothetical protein